MTRVIDLRSDTVTRPSSGMREAMARAEVGDDVYGEDPTVRRLEEMVAELLGTEAALFVPSGTMANQVSIALHTQPGDELIADAQSHVYNYESGALAALAGVQMRPLTTADGIFTAAMMREAVRPEGDMHPRTRVVSVENTHNRGGGTVWPLADVRDIAASAKALGLKIHLDGARLWNAEAASGVAVREYARGADTVSVCLSKGLGAPVGSLIATSRENARRARVLRHRLGGGMRQAGVLAAAGLYALEHHRSELVQDHANARTLAEKLAEVEGLAVDLARVQTNMVFVRMTRAGADAHVFAGKLKERGVLVNAISADTLRLVTHRDVARDEIPDAIDRIAAAASGQR
jgi:threonine aldolase